MVLVSDVKQDWVVFHVKSGWSIINVVSLMRVGCNNLLDPIWLVRWISRWSPSWSSDPVASKLHESWGLAGIVRCVDGSFVIISLIFSLFSKLSDVRLVHIGHLLDLHNRDGSLGWVVLSKHNERGWGSSNVVLNVHGFEGAIAVLRLFTLLFSDGGLGLGWLLNINKGESALQFIVSVQLN